MGSNSRRATATKTRPAGDSAAGLFVVPRAIDRDLEELEHKGLARRGQGGTIVVTQQGLKALQRRRR